MLLADDDPCIRDSLHRLLAQQTELEVVAVVSDGHWALHELRTCPVDVVLLDVAMPTLDGIEVAQQVSMHYHETKIVMLTVFEHADALKRALIAGAHAFVTKDTPISHLVDIIIRVHEGEQVFDAKPAAMLINSYINQQEPDTEMLHAINSLQPRLRSILDMLVTGHTTTEIAKYLGLTQRTVRAYVSQCIQATGCTNRSQLVIRTLRSGYTHPPLEEF